MDWKNKYLKYKLKYIKLKNKLNLESNKNNTIIGGSHQSKPDEETIFLELIENNLKNKNWDKKTLILDIISATQMQTGTNKLIDLVISKDMTKPGTKQLNTSLTFAVANGYYLIVEKLIKLGANPNIKFNTDSLVDLALKLYFYQTARVLMGAGVIGNHTYSLNKTNPENYNFSNDPENIVNNNTEQIISNKIYMELKEKLLLGRKFNFENLSRNNFKLEMKGKIDID